MSAIAPGPPRLASLKSKVLTQDDALLCELVFSKKLALAVHNVLNGYSWNLTGSSQLMIVKLTVAKLGTTIARGIFWHGVWVYVHDTHNPFTKPVWYHVPGLRHLDLAMAKRLLDQSKFRDSGTWKSKGSKILNKMRLRVPHP